MKELLSTTPPEAVVVDEPEPCPYLPGRMARRPLRVPLRKLSPEELDQRLDAGDRRSGPFLYNQACIGCSACEALRVDVVRFEPSRTQARVLKRGDRELDIELGPLTLDDQRVRLFGKHEVERGLRRRDHALDAREYALFLVKTCADGFEMRYRHRGELVAVAIVDRGATSLSAVYTFWDPAYSHLSPGTYSILAQIGLARAEGLSWVYLGLAIADNPSMAYKLRFLPHERRVDGVWKRFERA